MQEKLAILLAFVAGYMDATGIIKWKTYVSFMSGNTTQLGTSIPAHKTEIISTSATVIGAFVLGIYAGTCLSVWKKSIKTLPFYIVSGILMVYMLISFRYQIPAIPSIAIIGFSMGIMNTIVTSVGNQKVNTDFVTGTLNSFAKNAALFCMTKDIAEKKEYKANAIHLLLLWVGFVSGAIVAAFFLPFLNNLILIIPVIILLISGLLIQIFKIQF